MSPLRLILYVILTAAALGIQWVTAGSRIVAVLDRLTTPADRTRATPDWFAIDDGQDASLSIVDRRWPIPPTWRVRVAPAGHVTLEMPKGTAGRYVYHRLKWRKQNGTADGHAVPQVAMTSMRSR